jgi:glucokinase
MRIGLELCDQFTAAALVGQDGIIHRKKQLDSYKNRPSEALLDLTALCRALPEEEGLPWEAVVELGVCSPDFGGNGRLTWPGWEDIPLAERLGESLGRTVLSESRVGSMLLAEGIFGAARGDSSAVMVLLDTGEGGALLADDRLGEPPYAKRRMTLVSDGASGWEDWEGAASLHSLVEAARREGRKAPESLVARMEEAEGALTPDRVLLAASEGDEAARQALDRYVESAAAGIAGLVRVLQPQRILLGGTARGDLLLPLLQRRAAAMLSGRCVAVPPILWGTLGEDAALIGAALLGVYRIGGM